MWPKLSFLPKGFGRLRNGRTSSVFTRTTPRNMITRDEDGHESHVEEDPPKHHLIGESISFFECGGTDEAKEGNNFCSEELSEDVGFERNEKDALAKRIGELEKELYDYQYHMGLLLIERKMLTSEFEELRQGMSKALENLKIERETFSSTLSKKERQEHSILIALEAERQHVSDLERNIDKMQTEGKCLIEQKETQQSCEPGLLEPQLELKKLQNFLDKRKMELANLKHGFSEIKEGVEEIQTSFVKLNNVSNFRLGSSSNIQLTSASKEKEVDYMNVKPEKKERDLLATQGKHVTGESALLSKKQAFDQNLDDGKRSLDHKMYELYNLRKRSTAESGYGIQITDDMLAQKKEIEVAKVKIEKDKETLNKLYFGLKKFKQELIKKRDLLLSLPVHYKACINCSLLYNEIDFASFETLGGTELASDILSLSIVDEHMNNQNNDSFPQKEYQPVKTNGCMLRLQQCSELCNFNASGGDLNSADDNERKATDVETRSKLILGISQDKLDNNKRIKPGHGARKIEIIKRFPKHIRSLEQHSDIVDNALTFECQPNACSSCEQIESPTLPSKSKRGQPRPNKRTGSMKAVIRNAEEKLEDISQVIKQLQSGGSEDLIDANSENKLNVFGTDNIECRAEHQELLSYASGTASLEVDFHENKILVNEEHHKRQKTSSFDLNFLGPKCYNLRSSTRLKASITQQHCQHIVLERDSDVTDSDYEPTSND